MVVELKLLKVRGILADLDLEVTDGSLKKVLVQVVRVRMARFGEGLLVDIDYVALAL